jgi:hypothetical protein
MSPDRERDWFYLGMGGACLVIAAMVAAVVVSLIAVAFLA